MLSNFDFSQSIEDLVQGNVWTNRIGVYLQDGQLTSDNLGVLGSCNLTNISSFDMVITPEQSSNPTMSGVLLVGNQCTLRAVWVPTLEEFVLCFCGPSENEEDLEVETSEDSEDTPSNEIKITHSLTPGQEYEVKVVLGEEEATLTINGDDVGSIPCATEYKNVQVLASSNSKLRSVSFR